ncbi:hypothetical protein C8Q72DRAFT_863229 [Fomitopsis betulina]|nr:hypothetical protein C8Q72DRAFT_863229 [Fomitopsis betulina]
MSCTQFVTQLSPVYLQEGVERTHSRRYLHAVLRVVVIGDEGKAHLEILRKLARGTTRLLTDNHIVPLWKEVRFEDIVFTFCPYVGYNLRLA